MTFILRLLVLVACGLGGHATEAVAIVLDAQAGPVERTAADELAGLLGRMHPGQTFTLTSTRPVGGVAVLLGTVQHPGPTAGLVPAGDLARAGSYVLRHRPQDGIIAGADPRALVHGVFAALEALGCVFSLSEERVPVETRAFDPGVWDAADAPLAEQRILFDWHNFLSGCTGWDLPQWQQWIRAAARLRYTAIMVHAYGNNPMVQFSHNGVDRPVGWLSTTVAGRDWGTQHVNDVRRLVGGDVFATPVFGAQVAQVPDGQRVAAVKGLMRQVFAYAQAFGIEVIFAIDVDTAPANPAPIIASLPGSARYFNGTLPNPDAPEGRAYFRAMVASLMDDYPQIDQVVAWFRHDRTPVTMLKREDLPADWQRMLDARMVDVPALAKDRRMVPMLALSRIVTALRQGLDDTGHRQTTMMIGTWEFDHLPAADAFMPGGLPFICLDYHIAFGTPAIVTACKAVSAHRPVIPVVWAHHDDFTYIGRPYTPFPRFASQLAEHGATSFGIIHWLSRPLDLYMRSLGEQVWTGTRDRALEDTCRTIARQLFGSVQAEVMGAYLQRWVTESPQIGMETSDHFYPAGKLTEAKAQDIIAKAEDRLAGLERVDAAAFDVQGRNWLDHYRLMERFVIAFHRSQTALERSRSALKAGDEVAARQAMEGVDPAVAIRWYRDAVVKPGITRGEEAIIVSLNLRWLPSFVDQRQQLGIEPTRIRFAPTQHDPLAQGAGSNTFHIDPAGALWQVLGTKEIKRPVQRFAIPPPGVALAADWGDAGDAGIGCAAPATWTSRPLPAGRYRIRALVAEPPAAPTRLEVAAKPVPVGAAESAATIPPPPPASVLVERRCEAVLDRRGPLHLTMTPSAAPAWWAGVVIERDGP